MEWDSQFHSIEGEQKISPNWLITFPTFLVSFMYLFLFDAKYFLKIHGWFFRHSNNNFGYITYSFSTINDH